jgi:cytochrome b subunit of formate dehydrogenase
LYPVLDFLLIIPSSLILITLRKDFEHNIPWFLSSLSLLINSIADDGYVNDFVTGNSENIWFWELFYVTDFILISGALIWYDVFHISDTLKNIKIGKNHE